MNILLYLINNIFSQAVLVIGIVVLIGTLAEKKPIERIIGSVIKAMIGFSLINTAGQSLGISLLPLQPIYAKIFNIQAVATNIETAIPEGLAAIGTEMSLIFALGFLINILLARFSKYKFVHLSPHVSFFFSGLIAALLKYNTNLSSMLIIIIGSFLLGAYLTLTCAYIAPLMNNVNPDGGFTLGHSSSIGILISTHIGKFFKGSKDIEKLDFPKRLNFLKEMTISLTFVMTLLFLISSLIAGPNFIMKNVSGGKDIITFSLLNGINFGMWITVIITGVRMMVSEIIPAFHGIADKIIPDAMPGLDIPLLFPNFPISITVGFISSLTAGFIGMAILGIIKYPIIVFPALIPTFFTGAITAIFGNSTGGTKGAIIGSFVNGLILIFGQALLLPMVGDYSSIMRILAETDYAFYGPLFGYILKIIGLI